MSKAEELSKLFELKKQGILSEKEFNKEKAKVLAGESAGPAAATAAQTVAAAGHGQIQAATNFASCNLIQISCAKCKGEVQFLPGLDVVRCTFCGHEATVGEKETTAVQVPNALIPFTVTKAEVKQKVYNHLADDDFVPDNIFDDAAAINVYGIFVPAYLFEGKYEGNWTALSIVTYTKTAGGKHVGTKEQATPISGTVRGLFKQIVLASNLAADAEDSVTADELKSRLKQYEPGYVQGFLVESLGKAKSQEACEVIARQYAQGLAESEAVKMMPTSNYQNLAVNADITASTQIFLQPLWVCEIRRGETTYRIWLPGDLTDGSMSGTFPQDQERINLAKRLNGAGGGPLAVFFAICGVGVIGGVIEGCRDNGNTTVGWIIAIIGLIASVPSFRKFSKQSDAASAELAKIMGKTKQHRRDRMPRV